MLETLNDKSVEKFYKVRDELTIAATSVRRKFNKINNLALKNNDILTLFYTEETLQCLLYGTKQAFVSNNNKLRRSLKKLQTLTEPYTFEEYEGKRYKTEMTEEGCTFTDKQTGLVIEIELDDGDIVGFYA